MLSTTFVLALALGMASLLLWGFKALPAEDWQMLASIPVSKAPDGSWKAVNLTYYGFFSATGIVFGFLMALLLMNSIGLPLPVIIALFAVVVVICVPASRVVAALVEKRKDTFTIAGAGFVATILLPPGLYAAERSLSGYVAYPIHVLPTIAAATVAYALAESIGRLACMSFGCCYGKPLRSGTSLLRKLFGRHHTVFRGSTKKAVYDAGLENEALIPVQAITCVVFAFAGLLGSSLFLAQHFRLALLVAALGTWGWRAIAENLRADHRGNSRVSFYKVMSLISVAYLGALALLLPADGPKPDLSRAILQLPFAATFLSLEALWIFLFLFYGRSRVTDSRIEFRVTRSSPRAVGTLE